MAEVQPGKSQTLTKFPIKVPSLPPSLLEGCHLIDLYYKLEVSAIHKEGVEEGR